MEQVQHRCVQIVHVNLLFDSPESELISRAVRRAALDSASGALAEGSEAVEVVAGDRGAPVGVLETGGLVVVDVDAIERDVVLVSPRADDFAGGRHARLQAEELDDVARHERQLPDLPFVEGVADGRVDRVDQGARRHDGDRFGDAGELQPHVERRRRIHLQRDLGGGGGKVLQLRDHVISAGRHLRELVAPGIIREDRAREPCLLVDKLHRDAGNQHALRVRDFSAQ
jgi:hypothetical protein